VPSACRIHLVDVDGARADRARQTGFRLPYLGGPVLRSSRPYLIFWTTPGESISSSLESLIERFFTDVVADGGKSSNAFGVLRQYYDRTGFADYRQTLTRPGR
jgi:hypothetical protein